MNYFIGHEFNPLELGQNCPVNTRSTGEIFQGLLKRLSFHKDIFLPSISNCPVNKTIHFRQMPGHLVGRVNLCERYPKCTSFLIGQLNY